MVKLDKGRIKNRRESRRGKAKRNNIEINIKIKEEELSDEE